jgi:hypothetical protein
LLQRVGEIVESNETKRLPKLPKVITFLKVFIIQFLLNGFACFVFFLLCRKWDE